jgi:hypothetical protein
VTEINMVFSEDGHEELVTKVGWGVILHDVLGCQCLQGCAEQGPNGEEVVNVIDDGERQGTFCKSHNTWDVC